MEQSFYNNQNGVHAYAHSKMQKLKYSSDI